jgi:chloramphenicol-sensitive protein RarD
MSQDQGYRRAGLFFGLGAYLFWGVLPLYFKLLAIVPPIEIVANRILWSLIFLGILVTFRRRWSAIRAAISSGRIVLILLLTAALIATNWLVYVWAVVRGHVLETSLGYYLNPLFNVLLGVALLKERLSRAQLGAVLLAAAGVAALAWGAASGLWISLSLAFSFGLYGFIRKIAPVDALEGLSVETALLAPASLAYLLWAHQGPSGLAAFGPIATLLLVLGGAITAIPLLLFNAAAKRLPYSTLGFLQYIAPSLQFLLAVTVFGEPFTPAHALCFGAIWTALAIFAAEGLRLGRARARAAAAEILEPCP